MTMVNSYAPVLISGATLRTLFIESVSLSLSPPPPSRGPNQPAFIFPTTEKEEKRKRDNDAMIAISFHARVLFFLFLLRKIVADKSLYKGRQSCDIRSGYIWKKKKKIDIMEKSRLKYRFSILIARSKLSSAHKR